jgi:hypothetical protein
MVSGGDGQTFTAQRYGSTAVSLDLLACGTYSILALPNRTSNIRRSPSEPHILGNCGQTRPPHQLTHPQGRIPPCANAAGYPLGGCSSQRAALAFAIRDSRRARPS